MIRVYEHLNLVFDFSDFVFQIFQDFPPFLKAYGDFLSCEPLGEKCLIGKIS